MMEASIGVPRAQPGKWASCIRVVEPVSRQTLSSSSWARTRRRYRSRWCRCATARARPS